MKLTKKDKSFLSNLIWVTLAVCIISLPIAKYTTAMTVWWPLMVIMFFFVSIAMYRLCENAKQKGMHSFSNFFMLSTVVKLVVYLSILTLYSLNFKEDSKRFMMTFLAYYIIYSVFETYQLVNKNKSDKNGK